MTIPSMVPMVSSNVESIGFHDNELHVRFKNGGHYIYEGAHRGLFDEALMSQSPGKFIGQHVKGKFKFRKLEMAAE